MVPMMERIIMVVWQKDWWTLRTWQIFAPMEKVDEARAEILSGKCNVFDGKIETNTGDTIGKKGKTLDDDTITGGINWYYKNVKIVE